MKAFAVLYFLATLALLPARAQTVHVVSESTPFTYMQDGKPAGRAMELVEQSLQKAGLADYHVSIYPWARSYDLALKEPNVLIFLIARTPAREPLFKWAGEFLRIQYHFYKLRDRPDIVIRNLDDARAYTVGVVRDDVRHQYLQARGFTKLVVSGQNLDNFRKLMNRQVQIVPMPDTDVSQMCEQAPFDCSHLERLYTLDEITSSLQMAYSRSTPDAVVDRTRAAFQKLATEGVVKRVMDRK
jgi:polar amino acid transport system substrate-binding protein